jgi:murein DD-endopeptidase MepM/ murein hydrolase activator NlpD
MNRRHPTLVLLVTLLGCREDRVPAPTPTEPGQPTAPVPIASLTLGPVASPMPAGATQQLTATPRDASGAVLTDRAITWESDREAVAAVSASGLVTAVGAGTATVTARGGERSAAATIVVQAAAPGAAGLFVAPFRVPVVTSNVFDHDLPFQFDPAYHNGRTVSFWGEQVTGIDGHNGYDFRTPTGTPLLAVAPGVVTAAGQEPPFFCPPLNETVSGLWVTVRHSTATGDVLYSQYGHLSRVDVAAGQQVARGQELGLAGSTGCSSAPHLHFAVFRGVAGRAVVTDPFGWTAAGPDPWAAHPLGGPSQNLWAPAAAPALYSELTLPPLNAAATDRAPVGIAVIRYMGADDGRAPNNEYIELVSDERFAGRVHPLAGYRLRNNAGATFTFPANATITAGQNVRVYSGVGTNTATAFFWGRTEPAWGNRGDCVRLVDPTDGTWSWWYGNSGGCPALARGEPSRVLRSGSSPPRAALDWAPANRRSRP